MTTAQAAEQLGCTQSLVRRRIREGEIRAELEQTPRGEVYWITESALREYRQRHTSADKPRRGRPRKV